MKRPTALALLLAAALASAPAGAVAGVSTKPAAPPHYAEALFLLHTPAGLNRFAAAVSDPGSPRYRRYASVERLVERFGASPAAKRSTLRWLAARGLRGRVGPTGAWVTARVPLRLAGRLLPPAEAGASAAGAAGVPPALRRHVDAVELIGTRPGAFVHSATAAPEAPGPEAHRSTSLAPHTGTAAGCAEGMRAGLPPPESAFTPNQYLAAYGHSRLHRAGIRGQGASVAVVEIDGFRHSDIATFAKCFGLRLPPITTIPVGIEKPLPPADETTLDLEVLTATAPGLDHIYVYEGGSSTAGLVATTAAALGSRGRRPDAISMSLGGCEVFLNRELSAKRALDNVFAVAAGAGISVLVAAGDQGSSVCTIASEELGEVGLPLLTVSYPASSPFATAVGGTNLILNEDNRIAEQIVWNDAPFLYGGGGGGNSLLTPQRPWWQRLPALRRHGPGRILPDVAALADVTPGYAIYCTADVCREFPQASPGWLAVGGTSAATPLTAGGVLLANQFARRHGQRPLGFLNPLLYSLGAAKGTRRNLFYDVVRGSNDLGPLVLGGPLGCCPAKPGFDAATGWGSLKFPALAKLARAAAR